MGDRADREREFHDHRFADDPRTRLGPVYRAAAAGRRRYRSLAVELGTGADVLEVGCGRGGFSRVLGSAARSVVGVDLSPVAVEQARAAAAASGADVEYRVMDAEALVFPDASFDLVCGSGVLHHLDLERVAEQITRVLRDGGSALFLEPLGHNPLVNLFRRITPRLRSLDEHPLLEADLEALGGRFGEMSVERFALLTPLAAPLMRWRAGRCLAGWLERVDGRLISRSSLARRWAWMVVIRARD
jgi:SAM-dependent methyltransferase